LTKVGTEIVAFTQIEVTSRLLLTFKTLVTEW